MVRTILRFALISLLSMLLAPYVSRLLDRVADRAPQGSFLKDTLLEFSDRYSSTLIQTFGETLGDLVLPSK
jgi:hypothetical protein